MEEEMVLICDDNIAVHESLSCFLKQEHIQTLSAYTGLQAINFIKNRKIALVILDIMLPDKSGIEICQEIRKNTQIPILFLSAKSEAFDRILGLEMGGDDYVTKPFSPREVAIRVKKLLLRGESDTKEILTFEELSIDEERMEVRVKEQLINMTAREVNLLIYLIKNVHKVLNREQILEAVWGYEYWGDTRAVDAAIKRIRKKLPSENVNYEIQTIYGVGYRLKGRKNG